jgi:two-component system sensor histidine kinase YesM
VRAVLREEHHDAGRGPERADVRAQLIKPLGESSQKGGYGVSNVNERIQLSFGTRYGLRFESAPGQGTTVEMLHPLVAAEE